MNCNLTKSLVQQCLTAQGQAVASYEAEIDAIVQQCLTAPGQAVAPYEAEIDAIVARLYGLTDAELQIIRVEP